MSKERILITGATGFVGSHMADLLLEKDNYKIFCLKRWNLSRLRNVSHIMDKVKWFDCDVTDPIGVRDVLNEIKPDKIYHFAAESFVSASWNHPTHYMDVNYKGTVNIFDAMRVLGINPRILIPGSGEEYGEIKPEELPITEKTTLRPVNPYSVTKIAQDYIGYVYFRSYGLNVIRTRAFNHEGPRRDYVFGTGSFGHQIAKIEAGKQEPIIKVGHIDDRRNFTHIKDLVKAYFHAMEKCVPGEMYIIGNENEANIHTYREFLQALIAKSKLDADKVKIVVDPKFVRPTNVPRLIGDISKFRDLTNWKAEIPFDKIVTDILEYWRYFVKKGLY